MQIEVNHSFFSAVSLFCVGISLFGTLYTLLAAFYVRSFVALAPTRRSKESVGVTILKPLYGAEPGLFAALKTFCEQDYAGPLQLVFGVHSADDGAIGVVRRLCQAYPDHHIELVIDGTEHGSNRKVSNLVNMSARVRHEVVMLADSDIAVERDHVSRVLAALAEPGVGLVTCAYSGRAANGLWSRLSAAGINLHFLPSVLVGLATRLASPCFGSTIALRGETLAAIGGFRPFADQLADDYALGAAVRRLGLSVVVPSFVVTHLCQETSFVELWKHELRWARTIRSLDPIGYLGFGAAHCIPLALVAAILTGLHKYTLMAIVAAFASRVMLATQVRGLQSRTTNVSIPLLLLRDMLSFAVFVASYFVWRVTWRDLDYKVALAGTIIPLEQEAER